MKKTSKPVVLVILDGWGHWDQEQGNAIAQANLPTIKKLDEFYPKILLQASGMSVGLPWGVFGNSEVGHQTIGSGQIIYQYNPIITTAIESGAFFQNNILLSCTDFTKENKSDLHLIGLVSDGGVHSHINHLLALLELAKEQKIKNVYIHAIVDGRDTPPKDAKKYIEKLQEKIQKLETGEIATLVGRYYTMDRNNNWDRVQKGFDAMMKGEGIKERDPLMAIDNQYQRDLTDEYLEPVVLVRENGKPVGTIKDGDAVICFNFRKDRARQLTEAFVSPKFEGFQRSFSPEKTKFAGFTEYDKKLPAEVVFPPQEITTRLGEILSLSDKKQFRIAETEKYAHVTYFFNGGVEKPYPGEERVVVLSKNVSNYAEIPEMSAPEVTEKLLEAISSKKFDFILVNYANPDMVGHTGDLSAGIKAVEYIDQCVNKIVTATIKEGGAMIITADHGNVEEMINLRTGEKDTEHSVNPVPCWFITAENHREKALKTNRTPNIEGMLVDLAPTILELLGLPEPEDMIGQSLLETFAEKTAKQVQD